MRERRKPPPPLRLLLPLFPLGLDTSWEVVSAGGGTGAGAVVGVLGVLGVKGDVIAALSGCGGCC